MKQFIRLFMGVLVFGVLMSSVASAFPEYYEIPQLEQAQAEAKQRNLPLAWLGSFPEYLNIHNPEADATQMALATLQNRAVVIFFNGKDMSPIPGIVHMQFHQQDDGPLPNGANWTSPKVVFSDADVTKTLGRVSYTQMNREGAAAINSALQIIKNTPDALMPDKPAPTTTAVTNVAPQGAAPDSSGSSVVFYLMIAAGIGVAGFFFWKASQQRGE